MLSFEWAPSCSVPRLGVSVGVRTSAVRGMRRPAFPRADPYAARHLHNFVYCCDRLTMVAMREPGLSYPAQSARCIDQDMNPAIAINNQIFVGAFARSGGGGGFEAVACARETRAVSTCRRSGCVRARPLDFSYQRLATLASTFIQGSSARSRHRSPSDAGPWYRGRHKTRWSTAR